MRFIGNKEKLLDWIYAMFQSNNVEGETFFDFFSGTSSVGKFFKKKGYQTISSDLLYFSYVLQRAYLVNNKQPGFDKLLLNLKIKPNVLFTNFELVIEYLNNLSLREGFIYRNYSPAGTKKSTQKRMFFIDDNAKKIDTIRIKIEEWNDENLLNEDEYFVLLACLLESVPLFANILGVYAAFKKDWDKRALKPFILKPVDIFVSSKEHFAFNRSSLELLDKFEYDIIYLDPPYNQRQYAPNYHLLETIARYDNPKIKGVSGMREYKNQKSNFCNKERALIDLEAILKSNNYKHVVMSYSDEGIMPQERIIEIMKKYGKLKVEKCDYSRFKSNNGGKSKTKKYVKEQLYFLEK